MVYVTHFCSLLFFILFIRRFVFVFVLMRNSKMSTNICVSVLYPISICFLFVSFRFYLIFSSCVAHSPNSFIRSFVEFERKMFSFWLDQNLSSRVRVRTRESAHRISKHIHTKMFVQTNKSTDPYIMCSCERKGIVWGLLFQQQRSFMA